MAADKSSLPCFTAGILSSHVGTQIAPRKLYGKDDRISALACVRVCMFAQVGAQHDSVFAHAIKGKCQNMLE